jgi:glutamate dehydrogenase
MSTKARTAASATSSFASAVRDALAGGLHGTDSDTPSGDALDAAAAFVAKAASRRADGQSIVQIDSGGEDLLVSGRRRQRLAIVNADMPFLVDSASPMHDLSEARPRPSSASCTARPNR